MEGTTVDNASIKREASHPTSGEHRTSYVEKDKNWIFNIPVRQSACSNDKYMVHNEHDLAGEKNDMMVF